MAKGLGLNTAQRHKGSSSEQRKPGVGTLELWCRQSGETSMTPLWCHRQTTEKSQRPFGESKTTAQSKRHSRSLQQGIKSNSGTICRKIVFAHWILTSQTSSAHTLGFPQPCQAKHETEPMQVSMISLQLNCLPERESILFRHKKQNPELLYNK